jgi:hypothetical protein
MYNYQLEALEQLKPAGFKKQREFFFLHREPDVMVLYRKFEVDGKEEYYLAFTHTFFSSVLDRSGKLLIPPLLEQYPVSISTSQLRLQYTKHSHIQQFDCDLHHLSRTLFPIQSISGKESVTLASILKRVFSKKKTADFINPIEVALQEGLRFFSEFSPIYSYQVLQANTNLPNPIITQQLSECKKYLGYP